MELAAARVTPADEPERETPLMAAACITAFAVTELPLDIESIALQVGEEFLERAPDPVACDRSGYDAWR